MPYEIGGRADKCGNKYEIRWVIYQMLKVIEEEIVSVELESIGKDEEGIDVWITFPDSSREGQQCKGRNASKEEWDMSSLKSRGIIRNWKNQLDRHNTNRVSLVSPLSCQMLEDLVIRAKNTNNNPQDFLKYQIEKSSKEFIKFFNGYCSELNLDSKVETDLYQIIDYLKRTTYHQVPDSFQKDIVLDKIQYLFIGDKDTIYNCFENLIIEGDILSRTITNTYLRRYLMDKNILFKDIALDTKVASRIIELNEEYKEVFNPINGMLLPREEFKLCNDNIKDGKSIVIHGKAGSGKSGCTHAIISFCEDKRIPYIAIKLDKRVPNGSAEKWGIDLGLPASIAHSLHSISKNENAVIILDQLDALRWTQAHSRDSLIICSEIIRQVIHLNLERNRKISVVLVCRTYDLENDNNIKHFFKDKDDKNVSVEWERVPIKEFEEDIIKRIIGTNYNKLSKKLKRVLKVPSNLYIWQHLDRKKTYDDVSTANELIYEWWKQLLERCLENEIDQKSVQNAKENIVETLDRYGRLCISCKVLSAIPRSLDYLASNGFITLINNSVSFTHQSILDYFLVEKMFRRYFDGENIISIIGAKEKQTPPRRYQIQMLLQNIEECDEDNFINVGKQMLESSEVRFYVKYVFLEVLGQCTSINSSIKNFILEFCKMKEFENHFIDNVINGHPVFVELLLTNGVLDNWMQDDRRKIVAINLMISLRSQYNEDCVNFIRKYAFISKEDDEMLFRCFSFKIQDDTDEMFELRKEFYEHYPEMATDYIDFKEAFKVCELRAIDLIEFFLRCKVKSNGKTIYKYEEELLDEDSSIMARNSKEVIDKLLQYIPKEKKYYGIWSDWDGQYYYKNTLERACVEIIKKANTALIKKNPVSFMEIYKEFMGKGYSVFNEIILSGLEQLPNEFSNMIVDYIAANFNENIFDYTSGNKNKLGLIKAVLKKHTIYCSEDIFLLLEKRMIYYIDPEAKDLYRGRIEFNKNKENGERVYWSFWGDLQIEILSCLPFDRLSIYAKNLLSVLNRRFENVRNRYIDSNSSHYGNVICPIGQKKLGDRQWVKILTNNKLNKTDHSNWIESKGVFIRSHIDEFSRSFRDAVSSDPERFINLILQCDTDINESFINSLFSGVAFSDKLNEVSTYLLEKMISKYRYNYDSSRASYICHIIQKKEEVEWSKDIIEILNDIAINHSNPCNEKPNVTSYEDKEMKSFSMLQSNAINCARGNAAIAIGNLLWNNKKLYVQFKETVLKLCDDTNAAVRLANISALSPIYNIDRDWATEKIIETFEGDYRIAGYSNAKQLFFLIYPKLRERVLKVIQKCYFSDDEDLIKIGAYSLCEMYILNGEFEEEIFNVKNMNQTQVKSILEMALIYFNKEQYNNLIKDLIKKCEESEFDLDFPVSRIFYDNLIQLERDRDFLIEIMKSSMSRRIIHAFVHYLEENSKSIVEYKDIILAMSYTLTEDKVEQSHNYWGIDDELSKLIAGLYDEISQLQDEESKGITQQCLNIWDLMFEKGIGSARTLSQQILDR